MASRKTKTKRRKIEHILPAASDSSAKTALRPDLAVFDLLQGARGIAFQGAVFLVAFAIIFSRRPDALLNAQFYAEDGKVWYSQAYQLGLRSLLMPEAGYVHTFTRIVVFVALLFPFSLAPLVMNLGAIVVQILPANVFLSSRFPNIAFPTRLLASFLYLAVPNSWEINANITNVQWHLALLACLVLLARPGSGRGWQIFDGTVLVLTALSSPIGILLVPLAAVLWWKRRQGWSARTLALLIPAALVQALIALLSRSRQVAPNGATFARLISILGRQLFLSALLGMEAQFWFARGNSLFFIEVISTVLGLALVLYALVYGPIDLKLLILFAFAVLALGLARPLAAPLGTVPQWVALCVPGRGNRYYFLPMLASLASLFWIAGHDRAPRILRYFVIGLLVLLPIGICQDWVYTPFEDFHFRRYSAQFEEAPAGTKVAIPIPPGWSMELTKR